ncbi:lipopolysaccharide biosynthesis protein [Balneolaceae bacterium YR4-1]|uniref:Lipopolysaccharide biosynthesis protein n=1 Tax=Halalkalibaculum roseum TaxID=2709311 RepID=A0A6M1SUX9_9BACT|nr:lipopolysaccharide biosynthesis protein [Halalkalibaculum roseum]
MAEKENKKTIKQEVINSSLWGFLDKGSNIITSFLLGIVLARLLPPSDFGLIGLAMIIVGFGQIFVKLGMGPALIQKQDITERHVRVVFTTSITAGILLSIIVFASAPVTALIFDNYKVIPIVKALSIIFVISGLQIPSSALLIKKLDFRHLFYISLVESILYGFVSITLALLGFGVWSLVIGNIFRRVVSLIGSYWYVRHSLKPLFAKKEFHDLIHFGTGETLSGIFSYFALKGDYFVIGKLLGESALGLYTKAYNLMQAPTTQFVSVLTNVLFPTAAKLQADEKRLQRVFLRSMSSISFFALPLCTLLVLVAPELIYGLYGENWQGAIIPLQILGGFGIFRAMYNASASFLRAKGLVFQIFWAQVLYGIIVVVAVWFASTAFGLTGAAWAVGFAIFAMWCFMMELNIRSIRLSRLDIAYTLKPGVILAFVLFFSIQGLRMSLIFMGYSAFPLIKLGLFLLVGLFSVLITVLFLPQKWFNFVLVDLLEIVEKRVSSKFILYLQNIINFIK